MKKIILSTAIAVGCMLPIQAFADTTTNGAAQAASSTLDAGVTPDSIFYPLDKMMESIQLWLASTDAAKASLLNQDANERLAEAKAMLDDHKDSLSADTLKQYEETLTQFENEINSAINGSENVTDVVKSVDDSQKAVDSTIQDISDHLKTDNSGQIISDIEDTQSGIQDTADAVNLVNPTTEGQTETVNVAENSDQPITLKEQIIEQALISKIGTDNLTQAQSNGLNLRQILAIQSLAEKSGKSFSDVLSLFIQNNKGIGAAAKALDLKPSVVLKTINSEFHSFKHETQTAFKNEQKKHKDQENETGTTTVQDSTQQDNSTDTSATEEPLQQNVQASSDTSAVSNAITSGQNNGTTVSQAVQDSLKNQDIKENEHKQTVSNAVHQALQNQTKQDETSSFTDSENSSQSQNQEADHQGNDKGRRH